MADLPPMTSRYAHFVTYYQILLKVQIMRAGYLFADYTGRWSGRTSTIEIRPFEEIRVPSTKSSRGIRVKAYRTKAALAPDVGPVAVHLTWHGSGFVMNSFGESVPFIAHLLSHPVLERYPLVILDCDYAKAPEHPCPAATDDARDVLEYVFARPELFDLSKITTGGFSAGGNLALGISATLGKEASEGKMPFPVPASRENEHPIKAVTAFYPSTEWEPNLNCSPPPGVTAPGLSVSKDLIATFHTAYFYPPGPLTKEEDAQRKEQQIRTPLYTPRWAKPQHFPRLIGLITCEYDPLTLGAEGLRVDLMKESNGIEVSGWTVKGVQHAWDNFVFPGQFGFEEKKKAHDLAAMIIANAGGVTVRE